MTKPNEENYALARELIAEGIWQIDPTSGVVIGKRGQPFRRTNTDGYVQIKFRDPEDWRRERTALAHRVLWEAIHGPMEPGLEINHINALKTDNRLANLEAVDHLANVHHARALGLVPPPLRGAANPLARLTEQDAREIHRRAWLNEPQLSTARDFKVSREIVSNIKHGHAWKHLGLTQPDRAAA